MKFVIKHPAYGIYTEHLKVPRFRRKRGLEGIREFDTLEEASAFLRNRKENPGLEDCLVEQMKDGD